jgi:hypothetical protein
MPRWIILLLVLAIAACGVISAVFVQVFGTVLRPVYKSQPTHTPTKGTYVQPASGFSFPEFVGEFRRTVITQYDSDGLDVSAGFERQLPAGEIETTVYVYPSPAVVSIGSPANVVQSARSALAKKEFDACIQEIIQNHVGARRLSVEEFRIEQGNKVLTGQKSVFELDEMFNGKKQSLRSELILFCYVGDKWSIKYRFTYPKDMGATLEIERFMHDLNWTIQEPVH